MYGETGLTVAVVIPCYRVRPHILAVLAELPPVVDLAYCVDDACPDGSGALVVEACRDPRVRVICHPENRGVGGATLTGYAAAVADGADIVVKIDGDGQMDPKLIELFLDPIAQGRADYTKGNRFHNLEDTRGMPGIRLFGNACLSFATKLSSGYWTSFDPTNGYTAIERTLVERILPRPLAQRYFFESDMLFHLYMERAVVEDVPIPARYAGEESNLRIARVLGPFAAKNLTNMIRRVVVQHYLRDFSVASLELPFGLAALVFGAVFGLAAWSRSIATGHATTAGGVMLSALPILAGLQLCLSALNYDVQSVPRIPRHPQLRAIAALERRRAATPAADLTADQSAGGAFERVG